MGTTAEKLTYLNTTKGLIKDTINYAGAGLTNETFRQYPSKLYDKYLDILKDNGEELFNGLPKVTGTGTELSLNGTANTRMKLELAPSELEQATTTGKNKFNGATWRICVLSGGIPTSIGGGTTVINSSDSNNVNFSMNNNYDGVVSAIMPVTPNTNYILTLNLLNSQSTVRLNILSYSNSTYTILGNQNVNQTDGEKQYSISIPSDVTQIAIMIAGTTTILSNCNASNIMLRLASITDDTYEPYTGGIASPNPDYPQDIHTISGNNTIKVANSDNTQEQSLPLNLGDLEYCKIGDYADEFYLATESDTSLVAGKWYLKKNIDKFDLSTITYWGKNTNGQFYTNNFTTNYGFISGYGLSNILTYSSTTWVNGCFGITSAGVLWIATGDETITTYTDFITYLSNKNAIMYGVLATPTYTLLNDTLQTELNNIENTLLSYQDQTNISQTNDDLPFILDIVAIQKNTL